MTIINPKSISGITSITTASGADNLLTVHTNNTTERVRINNDGDVIVGSGITVSPDGDIFTTGVTTSTTFSGSGASLTNLPAANITGTLPAISGANLTNLDASDLASGTVPTARLGSGTASSSTFLRGDSTFQTVDTNLVADTTPQLGGNLDVNTKNIVFGDSAGATDDRLTFGAGTDLSIYHQASNNASYILNTSTDLTFMTSGTNVNIKSDTGETLAKFVKDGAVELYHNNTKAFSTTQYGVQVESFGSDSSRMQFATSGHTYSQIGYFGLNRFGIDTHDGLEVRDASASYATRMKIDENGRFALGSTTTNDPDVGDGGLQIRPNHSNGAPDMHFTRASSSNTSSVVGFVNGNVGVGGITYNNGGTSFNTSSDYRLKENVIAISDGITRLKTLKPSRFNFIDDETNTLRDGFIAHEVSSIVPEAITGEKDAVDSNNKPIYQGIDQAKLVPLLTAALQEAVTKIEVLETRLNNAGIAT